jgi:hypothetical protein
LLLLRGLLTALRLGRLLGALRRRQRLAALLRLLPLAALRRRKLALRRAYARHCDHPSNCRKANGGRQAAVHRRTPCERRGVMGTG